MISRPIARSLWGLAAAGFTALGVASPVIGASDFALELSIGIFGGFIAAITFALALTIQQEQAWPSARAVVRDSGTLAWVAIGVASLTLAVSADLLGAGIDERLATASIWVSVLSLVAGMFNVGAILSAAGGPGRRKARVRILRDDLAISSLSARGGLRRSLWREDTLDDFIISFRRAVEADDLASIRSHSEEIVDASMRLGPGAQYPIVTTHLRMASILGVELLRGEPPLASRAAFQDLLNGAVDYAGRTLDPQRSVKALDDEVERRAVIVLGETTRLAAFFGKAIWQKYYEGLSGANPAVDGEYAAGIMLTCHDVRERIRFSVDPDPPEKFLKPEDPWRQGVSDPESILLWLWANTDFDGTNQGSSLYSVYEVLLGTKYFGTVFGETSVLSDLRRDLSRLAPERTQRMLARHGGFDHIFLEVCANSLAQAKSHEWVTPPKLAGNDYFTARPRARLRQFVAFRTPESERSRSVDDAMADLLFLIGPGVKKFSDFAIDEYSTRGLGTLASKRIATRPAAAVVASALTLMSAAQVDETVQRRRLEEFVSRLPSALRDETARFAKQLLPGGDDGHSYDGASIVDRIVTAWR